MNFMSSNPEQITHVSDTALMVAACRALETARPDGFVCDPFAERLAGARGMAIARALPSAEIMYFSIGVRSSFMDDLVLRCISEQRIETVLSVGCGLDARPWRLELPAGLRWIEVDFQDMLDYKAGLMAGERPKCRLESMAADLNDATQRQAAFAAAGPAPGLMITEGLLMYLPANTVEAIATGPMALGGIRHWLMDVTTSAFSRLLTTDTFRSSAAMRDPNHLEGEQILELLARHGWSSLRSYTYMRKSLPFAPERLRRIFGLPEGAPLPAPRLPDDPSGVHLLACSRHM
jgi:methyltransferase (TIGR00027 family)